MLAHTVTAGAAAAQRAIGPLAWRIGAGLALVAGCIAVSAPDWRYAPLLGEGALAAALVAAAALAFGGLAGRAPSLPDEDW